MNKGFVFIETIVVLVLLTIALISMYSFNTKITTDINKRYKYDSVSNLYKANIVRSEITYNIDKSTNYYYLITKTNCTTYMTSTCSNLLTDLSINNIVLTNKLSNISVSDLPNSMKEYIKLLTDNTNYIIVNYNSNQTNYYASLNI